MLTRLRAKTLLRGTATTIEIVSDRVEFSVERFLDGLEERDAKQLFALLEFVAEHGPPVNLEKNRPLGDGIFELKTKRVRLFWFRFEGRVIVLSHGRMKNELTRNSLYRNEIARASELRARIVAEGVDRHEA